MSLELVAASSQYAEIASALVGASPYTIFCWAKIATTGSTQCAVGIATSGSANHLMRLEKAAADIVRFRFRDGASNRDALSTNTMSTGTWYALCGRSNSATARKAWLNSDTGTNTTSCTPSGMNRTSVGRSAESSGANYWNGKLAYVTIWDVALSDADVALLVGGDYPTTVDPTNIVAHYPFVNGSLGTDTVGGNNLTVTGGVYSSDEPSIDPPPSSGVTGTVAVTGEESTSSASGSLKASGSVAVSAEDSAASASGTLKASGSVSVQGEDATASAAGTLKASGSVTVTAEDAAANASGNLTASGSVAISGEDASASAQGNLKASGAVSVTGEDASAAATGSLKASGSVAVTAEDAAAAASGGLAASGQAAIQAEDSSASASGNLRTTGSVSAQGEDATAAASGEVGEGEPAIPRFIFRAPEIPVFSASRLATHRARVLAAHSAPRIPTFRATSSDYIKRPT